MKKGILVSVIVAIAVFTLGSVGFASAQSETPSVPVTANAFGFGHPGGMGGGMGLGIPGTQDGILHDVMIQVFADELGLTVEGLETRLTNGETMFDIASAQGMTVEEFQTLMTTAREQAIDQAVADGTLTQEQADWMKSRSNRMGSGTTGTPGGRGPRGNYGTGTCPGMRPTP